MRLDFRLLVVDDNARGIEPVLLSLEEHLEAVGFELSRTVWTGLGVEDVSEPPGKGRKYDLVMVDYDLGQGTKGDGVDVVAALRQSMKYTEMVFYSMAPQEDLYRKIAAGNIQGVFVAEREDLSEILRGLADIVIGKAVDLTHARGLAMAEVADIDALMTRTIRKALTGDITSCLGEREGRIRRRLEKDKRRAVRKLLEGLQRGVPGVLDNPLFDSHHKWRAVRKLAECLARVPEAEMRTVERYDALLKKRNDLAHVRAREENGVEVLRSAAAAGEVGIVIDDAWMSTLRQEIREHRKAIEVVCAAIEAEFGDAGAQEEGGESQTELFGE